MNEIKYDYLVVGSGFFGSVFARLAADIGKRVCIIEKRNHIGGNCYTQKIEDITKHVYGPHIFHTSNEKVWRFICKFADFNNFINRPKVIYKGRIYSFPINLFTLSQIYMVRNPYEAKAKLKKIIESLNIIDESTNLEDWCLSQVGREIYNKFIRGYTKKQWGKLPEELPSTIIKRLPIRFNFNDNYYDDLYQGVPIGGYTSIFQKLLNGIEVKISEDFKSNQIYLESISKKIIYTGMLDELLNYKYGELEYRSLSFKDDIYNLEDYQGNAVINYTHEGIPWTRSIEHKHFEFGEQEYTLVTREFPRQYIRGLIPYYPIQTRNNLDLYQKYKWHFSNDIMYQKYLLGGRLAEYKYYDMDVTIASAISLAEKELGRKLV